MVKHDRLSLAPILVEDFGAVAGRYCGHGSTPDHRVGRKDQPMPGAGKR